MNFLRVENLSVSLDEFELKNINISLDRGDYLTIIGPTGAGKTILLESIIGFHRPETGRIFLDNKDITDELPEKRRIGIVYQEYALMPHMTVRENIAFGLLKKYKARNEKEMVNAKVEAIASDLNIHHLLERKPDTLSGGEQQRTALARALIVEPRLLLMDEPLSALDQQSRRKTRDLLKGIIKKNGTTVVHITHELEDVWAFASKVAVFHQGEQMQLGTVNDVFSQPDNEFVAAFVGADIFNGTVKDVSGEFSVVDVEGIELKSLDQVSKGSQVKVAIRPDSIMILKDHPESSIARNVIEARLAAIHNEGSICRGALAVNGIEFEAILSREGAEELRSKIGENVYMSVKSANVRIQSSFEN